MSDLVRVVTGRPTELLPFEAVRESLRLRHLVDRGIQEVPLGRIVGTLGRHGEFNRAFLPREESLRDRWRGVERAATGPAGFPPVELYKVGEAYFVVDGHHRVSVERTLGAPTIEAQVKEFLTPVPMGADESVEEVLLKRGLADFLEATGLVPSSPDEYRVTVADGYERLLEHIAVHRYFRGHEDRREIPWDEAVASWRERVYRPMIEAIRASDVLEDFPDRTATDLYLFVMDHLHTLRERYGPEASPAGAVRELQASHRAEGLPARLAQAWRRLFGGGAEAGR